MLPWLAMFISLRLLVNGPPATHFRRAARRDQRGK
jgi:hypothetical protein